MREDIGSKRQEVIQALGFLIDEIDGRVEGISRKRDWQREKTTRSLVQTIQYPTLWS